jgi:hypothetical protein
VVLLIVIACRSLVTDWSAVVGKRRTNKLQLRATRLSIWLSCKRNVAHASRKGEGKRRHACKPVKSYHSPLPTVHRSICDVSAGSCHENYCLAIRMHAWRDDRWQGVHYALILGLWWELLSGQVRRNILCVCVCARVCFAVCQKELKSTQWTGMHGQIERWKKNKFNHAWWCMPCHLT